MQNDADELHHFQKGLHKNKYVFISHQWLSYNVPDLGNNIQYTCMEWSLRQLIAEKEWELCDVLVWVDYLSIPQKQTMTTLRLLAIENLHVYAKHADAFIWVGKNTDGPLSKTCFIAFHSTAIKTRFL